MTRWRVAGMHAPEASRLLQGALGNADEVLVTSDLEGVQDVLAGSADLFLGVCATGAGGALAMAQVFAGPEKCLTLNPGMSAKEISQALDSGVNCFGLPADQLRTLVPLLAGIVQAHRTPNGPSPGI